MVSESGGRTNLCRGNPPARRRHFRLAVGLVLRSWLLVVVCGGWKDGDMDMDVEVEVRLG